MAGIGLNIVTSEKYKKRSEEKISGFHFNNILLQKFFFSPPRQFLRPTNNISPSKMGYHLFG